MKLFGITLIVLSQLVSQVLSNASGANDAACVTLRPGHQNTQPQNSRSPYVIETNIRNGYVPCQGASVAGQPQQCGVYVRIRYDPTQMMQGFRGLGNRIQNTLGMNAGLGGIDSMFKGFILQARGTNPANGQQTNIGEFRYQNDMPVQMGVVNMGMNTMGNQMGINNVALNQQGMVNPQLGINRGINNQMAAMGGMTRVRRMNCQGFSVTHADNTPKSEVVLKWYPPPGYRQTVRLVATVVRDYRTYWMNVPRVTLEPRPDQQHLIQPMAAGLSGWFGGSSRATSGVAIILTTICTIAFMLFV